MVSQFRNYKAKFCNSESLSKDLTYTVCDPLLHHTSLAHYPNLEGTIFLSRGKIQSKDKDILVYSLNSFATHYKTPQIIA